MFLRFGKKKSGNTGCDTKLSEHLINYLNAVDEEYMKAFSVRSVRTLQDYVSRECAVKVSQCVFAVGSRYFGADKFRTTTWTLKEETEQNILAVYKTVVFDKVKIGGALQIGIADNYKEIWLVDTSKKSRPIVLDISVLKG